jgi:hypothetical protein
MATEQLYANASISGDADNPTNAHSTSDGTFTTDIDAEDWTHRWGFDNPTGDEVDTGTDAALRLTVRKQDGTGNPTIDSVELFDSTGSITSDSTGWSVTNSSSEQITISGLSLASLTDTTGDSVEVQIVTSAVGGAPAGRAAVQVDEIRLTINTQPAGQNLTGGGAFTPTLSVSTGKVNLVIIGALFAPTLAFPLGNLSQSGGAQTLTGSTVFAPVLSFPQGSVDLVVVGGSALTPTLTFPTGSVDLTVVGVAFTPILTFPTGQINLIIIGSLLTPGLTFPQGTISIVEPQTVIGVAAFAPGLTFSLGAITRIRRGGPRPRRSRHRVGMATSRIG